MHNVSQMSCLSVHYLRVEVFAVYRRVAALDLMRKFEQPRNQKVVLAVKKDCCSGLKNGWLKSRIIELYPLKYDRLQHSD